VDHPIWKANGMTIPDPAERPTVTVEEAGEVLGVSRASAYEAVRKGEIPSIKIGRRIVVPTAALRRKLELDNA
jgi:excisionase family DNA binding protein